MSPRRPAFPAEQRRRSGRRAQRRRRRLLLAAAAAAFDPRDHVAERGAGTGDGRGGAGRRLCSTCGSGSPARPAHRSPDQPRAPQARDGASRRTAASRRRRSSSRMRHCPASRLAAARTGAETASRSATKHSSKPSGNGKAATARAAAARRILLDLGRFGADRFQRFGDDRAGAVGTGAGNQVDQLAPAHGRVVAVARGLVQYRQQAIVEPHRFSLPLRRTEHRLYADARVALSRQPLTIPKRDGSQMPVMPAERAKRERTPAFPPTPLSPPTACVRRANSNRAARIWRHPRADRSRR